METYTLTFERTLAWHCAPALAGLKPADLISWLPEEDTEQAEDLPVRYDRILAPRGIRVRELSRREGRRLLLVYRPDRLARWLDQPQVRAMLALENYPVGAGLEALLDALKARLALDGPFPHEVGLFLGYPPADVEGFRRHRGRGWQLSGPWKVYSQVEQARQRFQAFHRCRAALYRRVEEGRTLAQLFPGA